MGEIVYNILIGPLESFFSIVLSFGAEHLSVPLSIIFLSCIVQVLSAPLYAFAAKIEKKEKDLQKIINPERNIIRNLYSGEEKFYKIDSLYKRYNYNPLLAFRASLSLFLVIPFFIAAFNVLNVNPLLSGISFYGLFPLSKPDQLLFGFNLLPLLMTFFNLLAIHFVNPKKDLFDSSNYILLALSFFFLVYLYDSSSALLLYWTTNNFIYMVKLKVS